MTEIFDKTAALGDRSSATTRRIRDRRCEVTISGMVGLQFRALSSDCSQHSVAQRKWYLANKTTQELDKIIKHKNIINFIRAQRLGWLGHIERMQETRMVKAIHSWIPISRRQKIRWEDDVRKDIQK
jgi:hypothetical protein